MTTHRPATLVLVGTGGSGKTTYARALFTKKVVKNTSHELTKGLHFTKPISVQVHTAHAPELGWIDITLIDNEGQNKSLTVAGNKYPPNEPGKKVVNPFVVADGVIGIGDNHTPDTVKNLYSNVCNGLANGLGDNVAMKTEDPVKNAELERGTATADPKTLFPAVLIVNKCEGELLRHPKPKYNAVKAPDKHKVSFYYMSLYDGVAYTGGHFVRGEEPRPLTAVPFSEPLRSILRLVTGYPDLEIVGDSKVELDGVTITTLAEEIGKPEENIYL